MKTKNSRTAKWIIVVLLLLGVLAGPAAKVTDVRAGNIHADTPKQVLQDDQPPTSDPAAYWTVEQMRNAIPYDVIPTDGIMSQSAPELGVQAAGAPGWTPSIPPDGWTDPLVSGAAGTIPAPTPTNAYVTDYVPAGDIHTFPYSANGKVYFVMGGRNYVCSASVIGENTIWTAGHCVSNGNGTFHSNWVYVPVFDNYTSDYPGPWLASYYVAPIDFTRATDLSHDYAIVGVTPPAPANGRSIRSYTGALGFAWNMPRAQKWKILGYPQLIFDGVHMVYSDSTYWADNPRFTPASIGVGSNLKSGTSGGPWILNFGLNQAGQVNYMNGSSSYISSIADELYSPYLDDLAKQLWDCSQNATPELDFNCFAGDAANNLTLIYTPSSDPLTPGAPFAYTIGIHNPSLAAATTIVLDVSTPVPVTSADLPGGACVVNGSAVQCTLASLAAGGTANVALSVNAPSASAYSVVTTARVKFDQQVVWDYQTSFETKIACSNTITVTNTNDSGAGSLRQALVDACVSGTINFDPSLSGATIRLSSQLEPAEVTIDGSTLASRLTISGDTDGNGTGDTRVFSATNVTFDSLIITQGDAGVNDGGGISGNGITVKNCILSENRAANGGGISSSSYLTLTDSVFSGNSATGDGGGVYAHSSLTFSIVNSTFSANSAAGNGGGIYVQGDKDAEVANSSFSGNTASNGGGLYAAYGSRVNLVNDTFSANSASVSGGGTFIDTNTSAALSYTNTIIANSTGGGDCYINNGGTPGVNLNNLVEDGSCAATLTGDPKLDALADNGGTTPTLALLSGSPAINAGNAAACAAAPVNNLDQRGVVRPQGARCSIGSYEAFLLAPAYGAILHYNRPTFDWLDAPGATSYHLQVSKNIAFSLLVLNKLTTVSTYTPVTNLPANTLLYWRVRSKTGFVYGAWSAVWTFTTGKPPSTPTLASPANGALVAGSSPLFNWNNSIVPTGTTFDHYQFQVSTNNTFTAIVHDNNVAGVTNSQDNTAVLPSGATYYWRVRSFNTNGDYSAWSLVRIVKIRFDPPILLSPADLSTVGSLKPTFTWNAVAGATSYAIQISRNVAFTMLVTNVMVAAPTYTRTTNLPAGTTYYWRVRANGPFGPSAWSLVFSFTTP